MENLMTTLSRLLVLNASCLLLTACGHIQKNITSTETLLDKAEFATGISAEKLKIVMVAFALKWTLCTTK